MTFHFEATQLEEVENFRGATCIVSSIIAQQYRSIHQTSLCLAYEQNKAARTIHFRQLHTRVVVRACVRETAIVAGAVHRLPEVITLLA